MLLIPFKVQNMNQKTLTLTKPLNPGQKKAIGDPEPFYKALNSPSSHGKSRR
jgi:hypothetical protein